MKSRESDSSERRFRLYPEKVTTLNGAVVNTLGSTWSYLDGHKSIYFDFTRFCRVSESFLQSIKRIMVWTIQNRAPSTAAITFETLYWFVEVATKISGRIMNEIQEADIIILVNQKTGRDSKLVLGTLRPVLKRWAELGYPGVSTGAHRYLSEFRQKQVTTGKAVLTMDPISGPYSDFERETILDSLSFGYASGKMTEQQYIIAWLVALFGQRPCQYAMMKLKDLEMAVEESNKTPYLNVPLAKSMREEPRSSFNRIKLTPELYQILSKWKMQVTMHFAEIIPDVDEAPFFPSRSLRAAKNTAQFAYHMSAVTITDELRRAFAKLIMLSERTGKQIVINTYRFRYTLGTNSIREGYGASVTAARLGHRVVTSVSHYVKVAQAFELHDRIDFATAKSLGTIAQAFKGTLISSKTGSSNSSEHIVHPAIDEALRPVGDCKSNSACNFNKPIACYTCFLFRAWKDGPHGEMYNFLVNKRNLLVSQGCAEQIITVHDRTITAVAQVVAECANEIDRLAGQT